VRGSKGTGAGPLALPETVRSLPSMSTRRVVRMRWIVASLLLGVVATTSLLLNSREDMGLSRPTVVPEPPGATSLSDTPTGRDAGVTRGQPDAGVGSSSSEREDPEERSPGQPVNRQPIAGCAVDEATGEPAVGAPFRWLLVEGPDLLDGPNLGKTDEDGGFRTAALPPGSYAIEFSAGLSRSFSPWVRQRLQPVPSGRRDIRVSLRRGWTVSVGLVDDSGHALAAVEVNLTREPASTDSDYFPPRLGTSAADGRVRFGGLEAGSYVIAIGDRDLLNPRASEEHWVPITHRFELLGDATLALTRSRGLRIEGRVVSTGAPPASGRAGRGGPRVAILPAGHFETEGSGCAHAVTARRTDGPAWSFESVPLPPGTLWDIVAEGFTTGAPVVVASVSAGSRGVQVPLHHDLAIDGIIVDEGGQPAPEGLYVELQRVTPTTTEEPVDFVRSGTGGRFSFQGVPPGTYELVVDRFRRVFLPAAVRPLVSAGSTGVVVTLRRGATVTVTVLDAQGAPVRDARVVDDTGRSATELPDGSFVLGGLEPGTTCRLRVERSDGSVEEFAPLAVPCTGATLRLRQ